jgi:hypothetical protein
MDELKEESRLVKVGKTILAGAVGAVICGGVILGIYFLKKNASPASQEGGTD